jgi:outer membrane protein TolC
MVARVRGFDAEPPGRDGFRTNLSLQVAGLRVLEARAQLGIAAGNGYPPTQEINGDFTWVNEPSPAENFRSYSAGFDVAWELDFRGKFRRGIESAQANLLASIASYEDFLVTLTAEVARSYILIRILEERIRIAQENVDLQTRSLQLVEARFQFGAVTELDVQQARTLLYTTHALFNSIYAKDPGSLSKVQALFEKGHVRFFL